MIAEAANALNLISFVSVSKNSRPAPGTRAYHADELLRPPGRALAAQMGDAVLW